MKTRRLIGTVATVALLAPSVSFAAEPTQAEKNELFRVCNSSNAREVQRCEARQLSRWKRGLASNRLGRNAVQTYTDIDFNFSQSRKTAQNRLLERVNKRLSSRLTYTEQAVSQDINTERLSYINVLRKERLRCMKDVPHGRPRSMCLKDAAQNARVMMEEYRLEKWNNREK